MFRDQGVVDASSAITFWLNLSGCDATNALGPVSLYTYGDCSSSYFAYVPGAGSHQPHHKHAATMC